MKVREGKPVIPLKYYSPPSGDCDLSKHQHGELGFNSLVQNFMKNYSEKAKKLELLEKIVIVGDSNVGKTCLALRYCDNNYSHEYNSTVGVDFFWKKYEVKNLQFALHVWDTAGQERFRALTHAYYRGAGACIIAFNLGVSESFRRARQWAAEVKRENRSKRDFCMFLVGCKSDMVHIVSKEEARALAQEINAEYFEVSAKTGENVDWLFGRVACILFERALVKAALSFKSSDEDVSEAKTDVVSFTRVLPVGGGSGIGDTGTGKGTINWKNPKAGSSPPAQSSVLKPRTPVFYFSCY